jgi:uncharacterized OsmC-like protein
LARCPDALTIVLLDVTSGCGMTRQQIAGAIARVQTVLSRRPDRGLHDDAPARARWQSGTRVISSHANGTQVASDMPQELGGSGDQVTPGWLFRAGLASCATTTIAMSAAAAGIELTELEVVASSRSDTRGVLGMSDAEGKPVFAGPAQVELRVRISADGVTPDRLRALVEQACRCAPVPAALENAIPLTLRIEPGPA